MKTITPIKMNCKAFSSDRKPALHSLMVWSDGTVAVFDDVAGHYTICHSMSVRTLNRARKLAAEINGAR